MNDKLKDCFVTFVCTGNTCRSPMAESLFIHAIHAQEKPLCFLKATSAGISAYDGSLPSSNAIKVLRDCGLDISNHQSRSLDQNIIDQSIALFCMTDLHRKFVLEDFNVDINKVHLLREFMPYIQNKNISDPFGQNLDAYKACRDNIVEAIPSIITFLKTQLLQPR